MAGKSGKPYPQSFDPTRSSCTGPRAGRSSPCPTSSGSLASPCASGSSRSISIATAVFRFIEREKATIRTACRVLCGMGVSELMISVTPNETGQV